jgi:hypothetical protein
MISSIMVKPEWRRGWTGGDLRIRAVYQVPAKWGKAIRRQTGGSRVAMQRGQQV